MKSTGIKIKNVKLAKRADGRDVVVRDEGAVLVKLSVNKRIIRKNSTKIKYRPAGK